MLRERFVAALSAGAILAGGGCATEITGTAVTPSSPGELELAQKAYLETDPGRIPLEVGEHVVGICINSLLEEAAVTPRGTMTVRWLGRKGLMTSVSLERTQQGTPYLVETFKGKAEADLVREYPRCDTLGGPYSGTDRKS